MDSLVGVHVRIVNNYGSYSSASLSKKGKGRIWFKINDLPKYLALLGIT